MNMRTKRATTDALAPTAQNLCRILIASYFMAVSLNLIGGTDGRAIALWMIPEGYASTVSGAAIFCLSFLVMIGVWLRPAALLLAVLVFWSSYITFLTSGKEFAVESFWRDLALIGALFLTYAQSSREATRMRSVLRRKFKVRRLSASGTSVPRRVTADKSVTQLRPAVPRSEPLPEFRAHRMRVVEAPADENIFADGPEIRVSA